jgi:RNA polymerase sigma factor (sigma-70 family)
MPGRRAGFEELFVRHYQELLAYALRRASWDDAHDVVEETFVVAWRRLGSVPDDALPWLYGVARRVLSNQLRGDRRRARLAATLHAQSQRRSTGTDPADRAIERDLMVRALASLPDRDREVLMLVAWEGLEPHRAAAAMDCSVGTFTVRLHRARKRLLQATAASGQDIDEQHYTEDTR